MSEKKPATFACVDHKASAQQAAAQAFSADLAPVVAAIECLAAKLKQEIRVDLPAMNPTFPQAPVSVTVPDFPAFPEQKAPIVTITVPDAAPVVLKLSYWKLALVASVIPLVEAAIKYAIIR